jgi:hypothetical protein
MDIPGGFQDSVFSFYYAADTATQFSLYSGLDATGTLLITIPMPPVPFFTPVGSPISGALTSARSVVFLNNSTNTLRIDHIGDLSGFQIPETSSLILSGSALAALGLFGFGAGRRSRVPWRRALFRPARRSVLPGKPATCPVISPLHPVRP